MPWDLWNVKAHAKRKGYPSRTMDLLDLLLTSQHGMGTQVLGNAVSNGFPLYEEKWTTIKSGS